MVEFSSGKIRMIQLGIGKLSAPEIRPIKTRRLPAKIRPFQVSLQEYWLFPLGSP
jgi:hypothetical protein